jgi:hypothetical protein
LGAVGFGVVREKLFQTWLIDTLESECFNAMMLDEIIDAARKDILLERVTVLQLLVAATARGGKFKSVDGLVTVR